MDKFSSIQPLTLKFNESEDIDNGNLVTKSLDEQNASIASRTMFAEGDKDSFLTTLEDDVLGPDTPGMRPLIPRLKRVQENISNLEDKAYFSLPDNKKRAKVQQVPNVLNKNLDEECGTISKFEWLHPSRIKDANGKKPEDPLYDKRTLYIPPDALRKMSASQRQYWDVKSKYMDVVLFFKVVSLCFSHLLSLVLKHLLSFIEINSYSVIGGCKLFSGVPKLFIIIQGKFYELYELDAEIGHKELDWKITLSGVGKCRQVISILFCTCTYMPIYEQGRSVFFKTTLFLKADLSIDFYIL